MVGQSLAVTAKIDCVFIVGAGFSHYAGLPLQMDFTKALLKPRKDEEHVDHEIVKYLCRFIEEAFDHKESASAQCWPNLEDIFTCIDLSANTGHHLGNNFPPSRLRTVRRAFITRIIRMLRREYLGARNTKGHEWEKLVKFFEAIDVNRSAFICTNWDTVVEDFSGQVLGVDSFKYGCGAKAASLKGDLEIKELGSAASKVLNVNKMHGSVNWLYCDNCRHVFWLNPKETLKLAGQLLSPKELESIDGIKREHKEPWSWLCSRCGAHPLGTRLATFSFIKALDFPMFQKSWFAAERILRKAKKWIFIGYSLPAADYEFKYLLKRLQLARKKEPSIFVVTGGEGADSTYLNYERFFGRSIKRDETFFDEGLVQVVTEKILS